MDQRLLVTLRPARPEDTHDVLELTRTIFNGHDYIPQVWEEWLADPNGCLLSAEYQGQVIGIGRVREVSPMDWWLEGLRVHPEFQGRGVGAQLHDALVAHWQANGQGALRLATSSKRLTVHHLCERTGFKWVGEYSYFQADALADAPSGFRQAEPGEEKLAVSFAESSPLFELHNELIDLGWEWQPLRTASLAEPIAKGGVLWQRGGAGLLFYYMDTEDEDQRPIPVISMAACNVEALPELLRKFRRLAGELGCAHCGWTAPLKDDLVEALTNAGYQRLWDDSIYIFENPGVTPPLGEAVV